MGHDHDHGTPDFSRAFAIGVALNLGFVAVEAFYGYRAHSLALIADAGHNLSDVAGLLLAWGAGILANRRPTARRTYGLRRSSILAALGNALLLLIAVGAIAWEAFRRFQQPQAVATGVVILVALVGIGINTTTALLFLRGRKQDLNIRGAFLHMGADAAVSAGVVVAALVMQRTGWLWLDPAVSMGIVVVITVGTWELLRDSVNLALDAVPEGIEPKVVEDYLAHLPGVTAVHDLHIWGMSTTHVALTAHLVKPVPSDEDVLLATACRELHDRFGIEHATLQIERDAGAANCSLAPVEVI
ncbi:MAG: cation diffusion facilitator family transporter [Gemmatimonadota bacterium]|nr:cation diffusion facilitator family transporter [Gemmatimonadota bacterium]